MLARVLTRQHVRSVYQPIVHLDNGLVAGYEALARPADIADDGSVEDFFRAAGQEGQLRDLDWLCRRAAVDGAKEIPAGPFLSINLHQDALSNAGADAASLVDLLDVAGRSATSVVIEGVRPPSCSVDELIGLLQPYRAAGMQIAMAAVDEADEAPLRASNAQPDYIKLARPAVAAMGIPERRAFATRTLARAGRGGPVPIAQGIEVPAIARLLLEIGFDLGQGFLLGRPAAFGRDGRLDLGDQPDAS